MTGADNALVTDNQARLAFFDKFTSRQAYKLGECVELCGGAEDPESGGLKGAAARLLDADNKIFVKMFDMLLAQFGMIGDPAAKDALFDSVAANKKRKAATDAGGAGDPSPAAKKGEACQLNLARFEEVPNLTDGGRRDEMEQYMHDCRRLLALGVKRWEGNVPGHLGPRVLDPDKPADRALITAMFSSPSEQPLLPAAAMPAPVEQPSWAATDAGGAGNPSPAAKKAATAEQKVTIKQEPKTEADKAGDSGETLFSDRYTLSVLQSGKKFPGIPVDESTALNKQKRIDIDVLLKAEPKEGITTKVLVVAAFDQSGSMGGPRTEMAAKAMAQLPRRLSASIKEGQDVEISLGLTMWGSDEHFYTLLDKVIKVSGKGVDQQAVDAQVAEAVVRLSRSNGGCGQTDISHGMEHAAKYLAANNPPGEAGFDMTHVIMITDGAANLGECTADGIRDFAAKIRRDHDIDAVHTLPLTAGQSADFCRAMADGGNGLAAFSPTENELAEAIIEICMPLARAWGFFIVDDKFKGFFTPTRDYATTTLSVPVGHVGTTFVNVLRVKMLNRETSFVVQVKGEFVAAADVPPDQVPAEVKDALDREAARKELKEKMDAAKDTYGGDVRKMAAHVRSVQQDMTRRGFSANATSEVDRMATQFEDEQDQVAYRNMSAAAQEHHTQARYRSLGAS